MKYKDKNIIIEGDIVSSNLGKNEQIIFIFSTKKELEYFGLSEAGFFLTMKLPSNIIDIVYIPFKFIRKDNFRLISRSHILSENLHFFEDYNLKHIK